MAGWLAGYAMALACTPALTYLLVRNRGLPAIEQRIAAEVPGAVLAVPLFIAAVLGWTMVGLVAGSVYEVGGFAGGDSGLGSPNAAFTGAVILFALVPATVLSIVWAKAWWLWAGLAIAFAGLFGWLLPHLAGR